MTGESIGDRIATRNPKRKESIMKQKNPPTDFEQVLKFLEALRVQLEDRDVEAIKQTILEYGLLVPIVVGLSYEKAIAYDILRRAQIRDIDQAIKVVHLLIWENQGSVSVPYSEFEKLGV